MPEAKEDVVRLHTHFNGVAERIAFVDGKSTLNATSTTPRPIIHDSSHSPHDRVLPDHPMEVDGSYSASDPPASVMFPGSNETPTMLHDEHNNVPGSPSKTDTTDATAMITDSPPADNVGIATTTVGESQTNGINNANGPALDQSEPPNTVEQVVPATANRITPDVISDTVAVSTNGLQDTAGAQIAEVSMEPEHSNVEESVIAIHKESRSAEMNGIAVTALRQSPSAGDVAPVVTITPEGTSSENHPGKTVVIQDASQNTPDILGTRG